MNKYQKCVQKIKTLALLWRTKYNDLIILTGLQNPNRFLPSKNFLTVWQKISNSCVYKLIHKIPKGGVLHAHISAIASRDFVLNNLTRRPHLYVCLKPREGLQLRFFTRLLARRSRDCNWKLLRKVRKVDKTIDEKIARAVSMSGEDDFLRNGRGVDDAWKKFLNIFDFVKPLVTYRCVLYIIDQRKFYFPKLL